MRGERIFCGATHASESEKARGTRWICGEDLLEGECGMLVLVYRKCSTCLKALKWLEENNVEFEERPIKEENPTYEELKMWHQMSGLPLKKFFNTSGLLYKDMGLKDKLPRMSEEES